MGIMRGWPAQHHKFGGTAPFSQEESKFIRFEDNRHEEHVSPDQVSPTCIGGCFHQGEEQLPPHIGNVLSIVGNLEQRRNPSVCTLLSVVLVAYRLN